MPEYRRYYVPGGTYFFTVVSHRRRPILATERARNCLRRSIAHVRRKWPIEVVAVVLLPQHLHTVWTLPHADDRYPIRWKLIKAEFSRRFLAAGGKEAVVSKSRRLHLERGVWQKRYWEHTVRDEDDLKRCVDYIHWNPTKHGLVKSVRDWPWSSFHRYVEMGRVYSGLGRGRSSAGM